jgi:Flp pilus assembly protein TadD
MRSFDLLRTLAPLCLLLSACAQTQGPAPSIAKTELAPEGPGQSPYGLFLAGQAAINSGRGQAAAAYFSRASQAEGSQDGNLIRPHTFTAALLAGEVRQAAALAPPDPIEDPSLKDLVHLTLGVESLAEGQGAAAQRYFAQSAGGQSTSDARALLRPYAAALAGDSAAAATRARVSNDPVAQFFAVLDQGKLFECARRYDEAETAYRALIARGDPGALASQALGELLERRRRPKEAVEVYDRALSRTPGEAALMRARERALAGRKPPPAPTVATSAGQTLTALASVLVIEKQQEGALAFLRLALRLDPTNVNAWLLVGDVLSDVGDLEGARQAYASAPPGSPSYGAARLKLAWTYQAAGDKAQAIAIARQALKTDPRDRQTRIGLADLLRENEQYGESASILDALIAESPPPPDWKLLYMRAVDYQSLDKWPQAENDLKAALKQQPDEPELLNFLGYSWIDRGENLPQALSMVQKAVNSDPKSGAMLDSLGWGYFKLGDFKSAVSYLEQAVAIEAGDPDVNNHLGDAYWRAGRTVEARYQWERVLTLDPPDKIRAEVQAKLRSGLAPAAVAASPAHS